MNQPDKGEDCDLKKCLIIILVVLCVFLCVDIYQQYFQTATRQKNVTQTPGTEFMMFLILTSGGVEGF